MRVHMSFAVFSFLLATHVHAQLREGPRLFDVETMMKLPYDGEKPKTIDAFFFDLDDCIYPFDMSGMGVWEVEIAKKFLVEKKGFTPEQVENFKQVFSGGAGAGQGTVWGALRTVGTAPEELEIFKDMLNDNVPYSEIVKKNNTRLRESLLQLPGPRYILTNNFRFHVKRVLEVLGVEDLFVGTVAIDDLNANDAEVENLITKPNPLSFQKAMEMMGVTNGAAVMVDDRYYNCEGAVKAGMAGAIQMGRYVPPFDPRRPESPTIPVVYTMRALPLAMKELNFVMKGWQWEDNPRTAVATRTVAASAQSQRPLVGGASPGRWVRGLSSPATRPLFQARPLGLGRSIRSSPRPFILTAAPVSHGLVRTACDALIYLPLGAGITFALLRLRSAVGKKVQQVPLLG